MTNISRLPDSENVAFHQLESGMHVSSAIEILDHRGSGMIRRGLVLERHIFPLSDSENVAFHQFESWMNVGSTLEILDHRIGEMTYWWSFLREGKYPHGQILNRSHLTGFGFEINVSNAHGTLIHRTRDTALRSPCRFIRPRSPRQMVERSHVMELRENMT